MAEETQVLGILGELEGGLELVGVLEVVARQLFQRFRGFLGPARVTLERKSVELQPFHAALPLELLHEVEGVVFFAYPVVADRKVVADMRVLGAPLMRGACKRQGPLVLAGVEQENRAVKVHPGLDLSVLAETGVIALRLRVLPDEQ